MTLKMYNTFTREKEEFKPLHPPHVAMYNCGPTVYDDFHIGNARNFVVMDVIRRYLEYRDYDVTFVQNITDIEDKIINRAHELGITPEEVADRYTKRFLDNIRRIGVRPADIQPKATEHIKEMIDLIQMLIDKKIAYKRSGDVFYRIKAFKKYGELSGKNPEQLLKGARVEVDKRKKNPLDFVLWKAAKKGEPSWNSPWGKGRPGWHIECSVMAMKHLGETIDIHSGGVDLVFPHHENERAQSEGATGKQFVRYWIHNGFLNIDNRKMSKSLGNFFTIAEVLEKYDPLTVRFFLLSAHYRHPLNFSDEELAKAQSAKERILECLQTLEKVLELHRVDLSLVVVTPEIMKKANAFKEAFEVAMDDDFNTAKAIAAIFNLVSNLNGHIQVLRKFEPGDAAAHSTIQHIAAGMNVLNDMLSILRLTPEVENLSDDLSKRLIELLIKVRQEARVHKQYSIADIVRSDLTDMGIILEDHPQGTIWKRKG